MRSSNASVIEGTSLDGVDYVDPRRFGARFNGVDDDAPALNAAFAQGLPVRFPPNRVARIASTLRIDVAKVSLACNGTVIDASGMSGGAAIQFVTSERNTQTMAMIHNAHPMADCLLWGPPAGKGVSGIEFVPAAVSQRSLYITGIVIERLGATGFDNLFVLGPGIVGLKLSDVTYGNRGDSKPGVFMRVRGGRDSGERIIVEDSFVGGASDFILDENGSPNTDIYVHDTSVDATNRIVSGGKEPGTKGALLNVFFQGGHWEAQRGTDYILNSAGGAIVVNGLSWILPAGEFHAPCKSTGVPSSPGVNLRDVILNGLMGPNTYFFCEGMGRFTATNISGLGNTPVTLFAESNNLVPDFLFSSTSIPKAWKHDGKVARERSAQPAGVHGVLAVKAGKAESSVNIEGLCGPGRSAATQALVSWDGKGGEHAPAMSLDYVDASGTERLGSIALQIKASGRNVYDLVRLSTVRTATPPGTGRIGLRFDVPGGSIGTLRVAKPILVCE